MSKFKAFYNPNSGTERNKKLLGTYPTKENAARKCYDEAKSHGTTYDCDPWEDVLEAIMTRDYYVVGYGPVELSVEEVEA